MNLLERWALVTLRPVDQSNVGQRVTSAELVQPRIAKDFDLCIGLVVGMAEAWRREWLGGCKWEIRSIEVGWNQRQQVGEYPGDHLPGDRSGTKNRRTIAGQIDDRAFDPMQATFLAHNRIDFAIQVLQHRLPSGCAGRAGAIGAGGGDRQASMLQQLESDWMGGNPDSDRRESSGHTIGDAIGFGKNQRHRAGTEFFPKSYRAVGDGSGQQMHIVQASDMNNQRVVAGSSFGLEDLLDSRRIESVGTQTENSFGRERHGAALRPYLGNAIELGGWQAERWPIHRSVAG